MQSQTGRELLSLKEEPCAWPIQPSVHLLFGLFLKVVAVEGIQNWHSAATYINCHIWPTGSEKSSSDDIFKLQLLFLPLEEIQVSMSAVTNQLSLVDNL